MSRVKAYAKISVNGVLIDRVPLVAIKNLTCDRIKRAISYSFIYHVKIVANQHLQRFKGKFKERPFNPGWLAENPGEKTMKYAYNKAIEASIFGTNRIDLIELNTLDELLPMSSGTKNKSGGGWWRLHEFGGMGGENEKVGASTDYRFLKKPGSGRFGEGIMIKTLPGQPGYEGFRPKRRLRNFIMSLIDEINSRQFSDMVVRTGVEMAIKNIPMEN